jgi:hypothetical protein
VAISDLLSWRHSSSNEVSASISTDNGGQARAHNFRRRFRHRASRLRTVHVDTVYKHPHTISVEIRSQKAVERHVWTYPICSHPGTVTKSQLQLARTSNRTQNHNIYSAPLPSPLRNPHTPTHPRLPNNHHSPSLSSKCLPSLVDKVSLAILNPNETPTEVLVLSEGKSAKLSSLAGQVVRRAVKHATKPRMVPITSPSLSPPHTLYNTAQMEQTTINQTSQPR